MPFMHIAEPFFEPDHRLAAGGEAKMSGLDDTRVHRADGYLMQRLAFDGQKW